MHFKLSFSLALALLTLSARADSTLTSNEMLIRLTVEPMPSPKPALRYLLLPELREMNPGNPIPNYLRCTMEQDAVPGNEVPGRAALKQADRAARLDKPDWQILQKAKTDGIGLLIPDVQKLRVLATGLQARFREELALQHFDDALVTAKTMFALSRHMGEHPTLIGGLVAVAIATITIGPLEEMLEQPGCPNLYWALTNLPCPMISMQRGMEGERMIILAEFHELDDSVPMNADKIQKLIAHFDRFRESGMKLDQGSRAWITTRAKDEKLVTGARRRLVEAGIPEERLRQFPPEQVIVLDEKREYEVRRDEVMKLMNLPTWEAEARLAKLQPSKEPGLFEFLVPALAKIRLAQGRLEQRIALLRHVEALRMYAAEHEGKLPKKLADVTVPLPDDPFNGKPFKYEVDGATAHLRGSPPPGQEKVPVYNVHYEVTIRK